MNGTLNFIGEYLHLFIPGVLLVIGVVAGLHALLNKRDPRSQLGWLVVCVMVPLFGALGYFAFGVNRIRTRARQWQEAGLFHGPEELEFEHRSTPLSAGYPERAETLSSLLEISAKVTGRPLLAGNTVSPLFNGEQAFPEMLEAIRKAEHYIYLCSYIFDVDDVGVAFIEALQAAAERGVAVYVIVDAVGQGYLLSRASKRLKKNSKVNVARYLPLRLSLSGLRVNLRNHRKLLVVDGTLGFTGGMNISHRHLVDDPTNSNKTQDVHFRVEGPAIYALEHVFLEDWWFATKKRVDVPGRCCMETAGEALCRGIKDGPNEDFEALQWILIGAIGCARKSVKIMTPYFIPSPQLASALTAAALRGVRVDIVLPAKNNIPFVAWAVQGLLPDVLRYGVQVYYQPAPFAHSKLLIVDDFYVNLGSANLDPRSLQLNFEFNMEVYDARLGDELSAFFDSVRANSRPVTDAMLSNRSFLVRLRDATFQLFSPYL